MANPGDLAFVGFNTGGGHDLQIVALNDIAAGEQFHITNVDFLAGTNSFAPTFFGSPQGDTITWTVPAGGIPAGTVITFENIEAFGGEAPSFFTSVSTGTVAGANNAELSLNFSGDTVFIYQDASPVIVGGNVATTDATTPDVFITALSNTADGFAHGNSFNDTTFADLGPGTLPTGLTEGATALNIASGVGDEVTGFVYTGDRSSQPDISDYAALINGDPAGNFNRVTANPTGTGNDASPDLVTLDSTAFVVGAADTTAPGLTSSSPADDSVDVAVADNIVLTFNEDVQAGTGNIRIVERGPDDDSNADDTVFATISIGDASQVSIAGGVVTINPASNLNTATRYFLEIDSGAIQDLSGNAFGGIAGEETLDFNTALPTISAAPAGLVAGSVAFVGFNAEQQEDDFALVALDDLNGAANPFQIFITDRAFDGAAFVNEVNDGVLTWTIDEDIAAGQVINFSELGIANGGSFADLAADRGFLQRSGDFAFEGGIIGDELFVYIGSADSPTAFLAGLSTDAAPTSLTGTGLVYGQTAADFGSVDAAADAARYIGDRATQNAFQDYLPFLNGDLANTFQIEDDGTSGEGFSPFDSTAFTLGGNDVDAPDLVAISPADEEADVDVDANIVLTFNENVQAGTGNLVIRAFSTDAVVETIDIASAQVAFSGTTVTVNPTADLAQGTRFYIELDAGAITDGSGNAFAGIAGNAAADFSTVLPTRVDPPALGAGAIAFTGFNFDGTEDDLAFVVLEDLDGSTDAFDIFFSDNPWSGTAFGAADETDGILQWTVNEFIAAGTIVTFSELGIQNGSPIVELGESHGLITRLGDFAPEQFGDTVYAYTSLTTTASDVPEAFLAALTTGNNALFDFGTLTGTGLVDGQTALDLSNLGGAAPVAASDFTGARDDQRAFADYLPIVNGGSDRANAGPNAGETLVPFDTTAFTLLDPPDLTVTIDAAEISEADGAAATTATVSREGDTTDALVVTLTSDDTSEAAVPATVTIAAGQSSASFDIDAIDDAIIDGTQTVTITASATDFDSGSDMLDVTDDDVPDAPTALDLSAASDLGTSDTDDVTSLATPTIVLQTDAGAEVTLTSDVDGVVGTGTANGAGLVTITASTLSDAVHAITATATLGGSGASAPSTALTITIDTTATDLDASDPVDGATGIDADQDITLTFSEDVAAGTGDITIIAAGTGDVLETIPVGDARVGIAGAVVTLNPAADLPEETEVAVLYAAGTFTDIAGNPVAALTAGDLDFTTRPAFDAVPTPFEDRLQGTPQDDVIDALAGNDTVFARNGDDEIFGSGGDDTLMGQAGNDTLFGGDDNDTVQGGSGADTISGDAGDDVLEANGGNDTLFGGAGDDTLRGQLGTDTIFAGAGSDVIFGNRDGDTVVFTDGQEDDLVLFFSDADQVLIDHTGLRERLDLNANVVLDEANEQITLTLGSDVLTLDLRGADLASLDLEALSGQSLDDFLDSVFTFVPFVDPVPDEGDDLLVGTPQGDLIDGLGGDDTIFGRASGDTLLGNTGADEVHGEGGSDTLFGGEGDDDLRGGRGSDTIEGGIGDDILRGGAQGDSLFGGEGDDILRGGGADDTLYGGTGNDTLMGGAGIDQLAGGEGDDMLRGGTGLSFIAGGDGDDIVLAGTGSNTILFGDGDDNDVVLGFGADDVLIFEISDFDDIGDVEAALTIDAARRDLTVTSGTDSVRLDLSGGNLSGTDLANLSGQDLTDFLNDIIIVIDI